MRLILHHSSVYVFGALVLIAIALVLLVRVFGTEEPEWITTVVETGPVEYIISVSGVVEAKNTAELGFPVSGTVESVSVSEGDQIDTNDTLVTLRRANLLADLANAEAGLKTALANKSELIAGPTSETRAITDTDIANLERDLARIIAEQNEKVEDARTLLLTNSLEAITERAGEDATAPTVSGTYACEAEGQYIIDVFSSNSQSGFSFRYSGLETGIADVSDAQQTPFGSCGLFLEFTEGDRYNNSEWTIAIPNQKASTYTTLVNAYELAETNRNDAIAKAEEALQLARVRQTQENAAPRTEALARADASIAQARASIANIRAALSDRVLRAPFAGTITNIDVLPGESVTTAPLVTLLADYAFSLTARIPEIDITQVAVDQIVRLVFDARPEEMILGTISFISPLAIEIDGVAYFEATISFQDTPTWMRSGLNADVDIITNAISNAARLPKRFVEFATSSAVVYLPTDQKLQRREIEVGFEGNDGYVEIIGVTPGTTVVAP